MRAYLDFYLAMHLTTAFGIVVYEAMFAYSFRRRKHIVLRVMLGLLALGGFATVSAFWVYRAHVAGFEFTLQNVEILRVVANLLFFAAGTGLFFLFFKESPVVILFASVAAAAARMAASGFYEATIALLGFRSPFYSMFTGYNVWSFVLYYAFHLLVMAIVFFVFARPFAGAIKSFDRTGSRAMVGLFVIFSYVFVGIQGTNVFNNDFNGSQLNTIPVVFNAFLGVFGVFVLFVQRFSLEWVKSTQEKEAERQSHESFRRQMETQQQNMQLINLKCHDLKHQVRTLLAGRNMDESFVEEVQRTISIYDAHIRTGNEALDVLLTEKSLLCDVNHIQITAMIEGEALGFMSVADINSFFGNAIDNAVEYLLGVEEDCRFIRLSSQRNGAVYAVRIENYCVADLDFDKRGLPRTTKGDADYHGFGTQSIKAVATKYGGIAAFEREDDLFVVSAMFML